MYACGPTVYDYGHIGNFRTFVAVDMLRRFLTPERLQTQARHEHHRRGGQDHPQRRAASIKRAGIHAQVRRGVSGGHAAALNIERPEMVGAGHGTHSRDGASSSQQLEEKGFAYRAEDGSYYFRIAKFPEYGKLSKKDFERHGGWRARGRGRIRKRQMPATSPSGRLPSRAKRCGTAPIGPGRPGWHIECSRDVDEVPGRRASTCTPAAKTWSSRTMRMRSRSRSR